MALLDALLALGEPEPQKVEDWPDYVKQLGLKEKDIEDLIAIATHESLTDEEETWFAPVHAWRALGQMRAKAAIEPLISTFGWNMDWAWEELLDVYTLMGAEALPVLAKALKPTQAGGSENSISLAESMSRIGKLSEAARTEAIALLVEILGDRQTYDRKTNGGIVFALSELKAVEAEKVLEEAHAGDRVDTSHCGSWAAVQVSLGLRDRSEFSAEELKPLYKDQPVLFQVLQKQQKLKQSPEALFTVLSQPKREKKAGFGGGAGKKGKKSKKKR